MSQARRITYTSTAADPEFRATFDRELARVRARFPLALGGNVGEGPVAAVIELRSALHGPCSSEPCEAR